MYAQCVWMYTLTLACQLLPCLHTPHYIYLFRAWFGRSRGGAYSCHRNDCWLKLIHNLFLYCTPKLVVIQFVVLQLQNFMWTASFQSIGSLSILRPLQWDYLFLITQHLAEACSSGYYHYSLLWFLSSSQVISNENINLEEVWYVHVWRCMYPDLTLGSPASPS